MDPILIASDHAGVDLKKKLQELLPEWKWEDLGPHTHASVDYPDFAEAIAKRISTGQFQQGILLCGSGIGMSIAANKFPKVRAAVVENPLAARLSREHNDANVLCLGARFLATEYAVEIVRTWLNASFSETPRQKKRIEKIYALEKGNNEC